MKTSYILILSLLFLLALNVVNIRIVRNLKKICYDGKFYSYLYIVYKVNHLKNKTMRQLLQAGMLVSILIFLTTTKSIAQDKITQYDGVSISGDIVSIDSSEIKLKYYPQNKVGWILRTFEVKTIKKIRYDDSEYNLEKYNIKELIKIFNEKENTEDSKPLIKNKDLVLFSDK